MLNNIKGAIRNFFNDRRHRGLLLFSGSFSRNEISVVNSVLISDMELLYIYSAKSDFKELKKSIQQIEDSLKTNFTGILNSFEIELEGITVDWVISNKNSLLVHQFEALKNYDVIFNNSYKDFSLLKIGVDIGSVFDILIHRLLNQISLVYNFENNLLNNVFYNRSCKNISDYLTYDYLYNYEDSQIWIGTKYARNQVLIKKGGAKYYRTINFNNIGENKISFKCWKDLFVVWLNHYNKHNYHITLSKINSKSKFGIIYEGLINSILFVFRKKRLPVRVLINIFERALLNSNTFIEFNSNIKQELAPYGYSKRSYIFLNGSYFIYWVKHYKYYKSVN